MAKRRNALDNKDDRASKKRCREKLPKKSGLSELYTESEDSVGEESANDWKPSESDGEVEFRERSSYKPPKPIERDFADSDSRDSDDVSSTESVPTKKTAQVGIDEGMSFAKPAKGRVSKDAKPVPNVRNESEKSKNYKNDFTDPTANHEKSSVSLRVFVRMLIIVLKCVTSERTDSEFGGDVHRIYAEAKDDVENDLDQSDPIGNARDEDSDNQDTTKTAAISGCTDREYRTLRAFNKLVVSLEEHGYSLGFSREHAKYFLATHRRHIRNHHFQAFQGVNDSGIGKSVYKPITRGPPVVENAGETVTGHGSGETSRQSRKKKKDKKSAIVKGRKAPKNKKSKPPIPQGLILLEYTKGVQNFVSCIANGNFDDILALTVLVGEGISLPQSVYWLMCPTFGPKLRDCIYVNDANKYTFDKDEYAAIEVKTVPKRAAFLFTRFAFLMFDGYQLVLPPPALEKEILESRYDTIRMSDRMLKEKSYVLVDALIGGNKFRILDMIQWDTRGKASTEETYKGRLEALGAVMNSIGRSLKPSFDVSDMIRTGSTLEEGTYILKRKRGGVMESVNYIYVKPNLTAAAVGLTDHGHVCLAFRQNGGFELVMRTLASLTGPAVPTLLTAMTRPVTADEEATNVYETSFQGLKTDLRDPEGEIKNRNARIYLNAVPVEVKDSVNFKLGNVSRDHVSEMSRIRSPVPTKLRAQLESVKTMFENPQLNPALAKEVVREMLSVMMRTEGGAKYADILKITRQLF